MSTQYLYFVKAPSSPRSSRPYLLINWTFLIVHSLSSSPSQISALYSGFICVTFSVDMLLIWHDYLQFILTLFSKKTALILGDKMPHIVCFANCFFERGSSKTIGHVIVWRNCWQKHYWQITCEQGLKHCYIYTTFAKFFPQEDSTF